MTADIIEKFIDTKADREEPISIFFKQRNTITGIFIRHKDYEELKSKNFWRIVSGTHLEEWKRTRDVNLARLFSGNDFSKLK
ncbi:MAG: hypothetical protein RL172_1016 [Bacteroidota bacterium]|jgi:hypothetical protein